MELLNTLLDVGARVAEVDGRRPRSLQKVQFPPDERAELPDGVGLCRRRPLRPERGGLDGEGQRGHDGDGGGATDLLAKYAIKPLEDASNLSQVSFELEVGHEYECVL